MGCSVGSGQQTEPRPLPFPSEAPVSPPCRFSHVTLVTRWLGRAGWGLPLLMNCRHRQCDSPGAFCLQRLATPFPESAPAGGAGHWPCDLLRRSWGLGLPPEPGPLSAPPRLLGRRTVSCGPTASQGSRGQQGPDLHRRRERGRLPGRPALTGRSPPPPLGLPRRSPSGRQAPRGAGSWGRIYVSGAPALKGAPGPVQSSVALGAAAALRPRCRLGQVGGRHPHLQPGAAHAPGAAGSQGAGGGPARAASARHAGETRF